MNLNRKLSLLPVISVEKPEASNNCVFTFRKLQSWLRWLSRTAWPHSWSESRLLSCQSWAREKLLLQSHRTLSVVKGKDFIPTSALVTFEDALGDIPARFCLFMLIVFYVPFKATVIPHMFKKNLLSLCQSSKNNLSKKFWEDKCLNNIRFHFELNFSHTFALIIISCKNSIDWKTD